MRANLLTFCEIAKFARHLFLFCRQNLLYLLLTMADLHFHAKLFVDMLCQMLSGIHTAMLVKGDMLGDVIFYGKGAGKLPTASAVVADVVDAIKEGSKVHDSPYSR